MIIFRLLVLVSLVRLLIVTNKPLLCTGIYAALVTVGTVVGGGGIVAVIMAGAIAFVSAGIYFWLLNRFDGSFLWWIIMVLGTVIGLV